jgi:hypothetical protein
MKKNRRKKMIKGIIALIFGIVGAIVYKLCIPVMFLLIACKLWYEPYTWTWFETIFVPFACGVCGFIAVLIAKDIVE